MNPTEDDDRSRSLDREVSARTDSSGADSASDSPAATARWHAALGAYGDRVAAELDRRGVRVLLCEVNVDLPSFGIDLAVFHLERQVLEFYFTGELGWFIPAADGCGRIRTQPHGDPNAADVAVPPAVAAREIAKALRGHIWGPNQAVSRTIDRDYLTALLAMLEHYSPPRAV